MLINHNKQVLPSTPLVRNELCMHAFSSNNKANLAILLCGKQIGHLTYASTLGKKLCTLVANMHAWVRRLRELLLIVKHVEASSVTTTLTAKTVTVYKLNTQP